jgi:hypothetical protein
VADADRYAVSKRYADPRLCLEVVDRIFLDDWHADFERDFQIVGQFHAGQSIEGEKKPSSLTGFRSAKIDADIVARIERQKPAAWNAASPRPNS